MAEEATEEVGSFRLRWVGEGPEKAIKKEDEHDFSEMKGNLASLRLFISGEGTARAKDEQDIFQIKEDEVSLRLFIPSDVKMKADKEGRGSFRSLAVNFFGGEICV